MAGARQDRRERDHRLINARYGKPIHYGNRLQIGEDGANTSVPPSAQPAMQPERRRTSYTKAIQDDAPMQFSNTWQPLVITISFLALTQAQTLDPKLYSE